MRDCSTCGQPNSEDAEFCADPQCRAYLGWSTTMLPTTPPTKREFVDEAYATAGIPPGPRRPPPPSAPPAAPGGQRAGVRLTLEPTQIAVDPGGAVVTTVTVHNTGTRVEEFELGVSGPPRPYTHIEPAVVNVFPDAKATAVIRFAPPRDPGVPAGRAEFVVGARSRIDARVEDRVPGALDIGAFTELKAELRPESSRGRKPALHHVVTTNRGNVALGVRVALTDREGALTFQPPQAISTLPAGSSVETPVLVGGARKWFGRTVAHPFLAQVSPADGAPPVGLNGVRNQVPVLPWWVPTAVAVVLALAIAVIAVWPAADPTTVPSTAGLVQSEAEVALRNAGYTPFLVAKPDATIPAGTVIGTEPAAGSALDSGSQVTVSVSAGPCEGDCPVEVPNVTGMAVADAQVATSAAEFEVGILEQVNPAIGKGLVISSDPPSGQKRPRGSKVVLNVSSGPAPTTAPADTPEVTTGGSTGASGAGNGGGGVGSGGGGDKAADTVEVPDVVGKSKTEAASKIGAVGLSAAFTEQPDAKVAAGTVIATDPAAKTKVNKGSTVKVSVSSGPPPVELPDLSAKTEAEALSALSALGLTAEVREQPDMKIADGSVISTTPAARTKVAKGSKVTVLVSQGRPCISGYTFRLADADDHVCVLQARADDTLAENKAGPSLISKTDRTYGPDTCVQGYVWREATKTDHVCVLPQSRTDAAKDNQDDPKHHVK